MTWREYFKDSDLTKVPQEFLDKEIIVDDCLQMISMMSFTIKELLDKTKWHTGTPTKEGLYLVTDGYDYDIAEWTETYKWMENSVISSKYIIAYQEIFLYEVANTKQTKNLQSGD